VKTLLLTKDFLVPPDARQSTVTHSQKESWLRLMERERSSQFASISAEVNGKTENSSLPFAGGMEMVHQRVLASGCLPRKVSEIVALPQVSLFREGVLPIGRGGYACPSSGVETALLPSALPIARDGDAVGAALDGITVGAEMPDLERLFRQRWPRANVLIAKDDDGVRIWLRDPDLLKDRSVLTNLVAQIKKELASQGVSLAALTVNGETVFCNQEG
jgi:hypothetical protein